MYSNEQLYQAILKGNLDVARDETSKAVEAGAAADEIINGCMIGAMAEIGADFEAGRAFVPNLLLSARAMKGALDILKPLMLEGCVTTVGKVVIGTVRGDLHDIGKNLVASMLEGSGFQVVNLGTDVPVEKFISAAKENDADIICLSALLTTTMEYMKVVIDAVKAEGLRTKIMIGGAPVSKIYADRIGADGYSDNANSAVALARSLVGA